MFHLSRVCILVCPTFFFFFVLLLLLFIIIIIIIIDEGVLVEEAWNE